MSREPFWEQAYRDGGPDPFGAPSPEVLDLLERLPPRASVLDLGCGAGRNALPLAQAGMDVTAVDASRVACARLEEAAGARGAFVRVVTQDIRMFDFRTLYDVTIAHGVLHLLPHVDRVQVLERIQAHTSPGGINVVAVFTNRLPPPPDLADVMLGPFDEGELFDAYAHWNIILERAYTLHDQHPGGIFHEHPVNKIVARKPP